MNQGRWTRYDGKSFAHSTLRLRRLKETETKLRAYIRSQTRQSDECKAALVTLVEEIIGLASREEAAKWISRLIEKRFEDFVGNLSAKRNRSCGRPNLR